MKMKPIMRVTMLLLLMLCSVNEVFCITPSDGKGIASRYPIVSDKPSPDFFEGALLGNGGMGIVVTTRPDAVVIHFGHNNVWDIRVCEDYEDQIGSFQTVFEKVCMLSDSLNSIQDDKWFADYLWLTADNYRKPYPRPFPCGSLVLGFDRRNVELIGHSLDISNGICHVNFLTENGKTTLDIMADMKSDKLWLELTDGDNKPIGSIFNRVRLIPDPSTPGELPRPIELSTTDYEIGFMQQLPPTLEAHDKRLDKAFALQLFSSVPIQANESDLPFVMCTVLTEGFLPEVSKAIESEHVQPTEAAYAECKLDNERVWEDYWAASSVELADKELEAMWYRNLYFYNCAVKPGVICPGIFANWSYANIGTAWHGDYHLNYNTQQPFWLSFSSNHVDKNLAYVGLVEHLLPISRKWAKEYYGMRGAFFPHSAYPVEMNMHPYPVPDWGWEVFETPWMVQGLWWHYLYTGDVDFLRDRAFVPMKEAVSFLVDYMTRADAHGERWGDDKYHIFPSVPPELYGLQPGFKKNYDTQIDITLTKQIFNGYLKSVDILGIGKQEKNLVKDVKKILKAMPDYPTLDTERYGKILVSVPGETEDVVYNVPANLAVVFPGNEYGLNSPDSIQALVRSTIKAHRNEGGNEIVFLNIQKARMGMLDLDVFKRSVRYATLPNQTITDAVTEVGGRYSDMTDFMYMAPMGIWFENFAIAAVLNECLMQSHEGVIRLFPNWDKNREASFRTLRAMGAFLVSASASDGSVSEVNITSENGGECKVYNPWPGKNVILQSEGKELTLTEHDGIIKFPTEPGKEYMLVCRRGK